MSVEDSGRAESPPDSNKIDINISSSSCRVWLRLAQSRIDSSASKVLGACIRPKSLRIIELDIVFCATDSTMNIFGHVCSGHGVGTHPIPILKNASDPIFFAATVLFIFVDSHLFLFRLRRQLC